MVGALANRAKLAREKAGLTQKQACEKATHTKQGYKPSVPETISGPSAAAVC